MKHVCDKCGSHVEIRTAFIDMRERKNGKRIGTTIQYSVCALQGCPERNAAKAIERAKEEWDVRRKARG